MRFFYTSSILFLLANFYAPSITAQDSLSINKNLIEVIVTTKISQKNINTPRTIAVVNIDKQKQNGVNKINEILNTASGVYMVDMGNEQHAMSIRLPINYSPLYNYLENGIPLRPVGIFNNNEILEVNKFSLHKVELLKGPFSSGYGAQSIGAAVNFIQLKFENTKNEITLQSNGFGQWESMLQYKNKIGKWNFVANVNHVQRKVNSDYHFDYTKKAYSISAERKLNNKNEIILRSNLVYYNGDQRDGYDSATFYKKNYTSFDKFSDRKTLAIRNTFDWLHTFNDYQNLSITLFNRVINEKQNPFYLISYDYANPSTTKATGQITNDIFTSYGLNVNHNFTSKNKKLKLNQNLFIDLTPKNLYKSNFINVTRSAGVNVSFTNPDSLLTNYKANLKNVALSFSGQYNRAEKIVFFAGVRFDKLAYKFKNYLSSNAYSGSPSGNNVYFSVSPELSFLYKINKSQSVFIQYGSGFAPPTLSNLYRGVKTPILTPAKYYNSEIGYKYFAKNIQVQLSLYNMNGKDEFVSVIRNTGVEVVNAGQTNHKGIELDLKYATNKIECSFTPSVQKHIFKSYNDYGKSYDGNKINGAPSYLHNASLVYKIAKFKELRIIADWNVVGPYKINADNTKTYNGYSLVNLKCTFKLNKFFVNTGVNNLLNKVYATNADGTYGVRYYPGLPRTLQMGITYSY